MAIIIKKGAGSRGKAQDTVVKEVPKPVEEEVGYGTWKPKPKGWVPGSNDQPRPCKLCGNMYWNPCDGQNPNCMPVIWKAKEGQR